MAFFDGAKYVLAGVVTAVAMSCATAGAAEKFNLSPDTSNRIRAEKDEAAIKAITPGFKFVNPGKFTVAINAWDPPIATYATDAKTVVGADPDIAQLLADSLVCSSNWCRSPGKTGRSASPPANMMPSSPT